MYDNLNGKGTPDTCFTKMAYFAKDLANFRLYLIANDFPKLIANLLYLPAAFPILLLNVLRIELIQTITAFMLLAFGILISGFIFAAGYVMIKGAKSTYDKEHKANDDNSESEGQE